MMQLGNPPPVAAFTRQGSQVQSLQRPPSKPLNFLHNGTRAGLASPTQTDATKREPTVQDVHNPCSPFARCSLPNHNQETTQ